MVTRRIYCDYAASTPIAPDVSLAMRTFLESHGAGNASSLHYDGRALRERLDGARDQVAALLGCDFKDVLFTSGGTESDNLAIIGAILSRRETGRNGIVIGASEHHAVVDAAHFAARFLGADVRIAHVDEAARVDVEHLKSLVDDSTAIVSIQHANNEIGSIQPVQDIAAVAHACGAWFHCDAVQTPITVPFTVADLDADLVTISSHKIYGPVGAGGLYSRVPIQPTQVGGTQERGLRAGSENVLGAIGFGVAAGVEIARRSAGRIDIQAVAESVHDLRLRLMEFQGVTINTPAEDAISTTMHISIAGWSTEDILMLLDRKGISASGGSACASGAVEPSHVIKACGWSNERQNGALRLSFGIGTTTDDIGYVADVVGLIADKG
jgi:cysteine desulfurase